MISTKEWTIVPGSLTTPDHPRPPLDFQRRFPNDAASIHYLADQRWFEGFQPRLPRWLLHIVDKGSTKGVSERVRPYTGTIEHDLPLYLVDLLMRNRAHGHFLR